MAFQFVDYFCRQPQYRILQHWPFKPKFWLSQRRLWLSNLASISFEVTFLSLTTEVLFNLFIRKTKRISCFTCWVGYVEFTFGLTAEYFFHRRGFRISLIVFLFCRPCVRVKTWWSWFLKIHPESSPFIIFTMTMYSLFDGLKYNTHGSFATFFIFQVSFLCFIKSAM